MSETVFDVLIVGGGLVGTTLACALGQSADESGLKVGLIEAGEPLALTQLRSNRPFDARVSALTQASRQLLTNLAVWPLISQQRFGLMEKMVVWDADGTGRVTFRAEDIGQSELGYIVENRVTVACLFERLRALEAVALIAPARVARLIHLPQGLQQVTLEDGRVLQSRLVVGADGARSRVRELAGIDCREKGYGQRAVVTTVRTQQPHQHTAWQRFLATGPLAFLPLRSDEGDDHASSIVWSLDEAQAEAVMTLNDADFAGALERAFESRLGPVTQVDERFCYPLCQRHAQQYVQPGLALIGDAAHTIHPLAGQGVNLGLLDAAVLAEELLRAQRRGLAAGELSVLQRYQRRRRGDNTLMMAAMSGFKTLFAETALPVRWLRNTGMRCFDHLPPVKNHVAAQAMGLSGDLPALAKPNYFRPTS